MTYKEWKKIESGHHSKAQGGKAHGKRKENAGGDSAL